MLSQQKAKLTHAVLPLNFSTEPFLLVVGYRCWRSCGEGVLEFGGMYTMARYGWSGIKAGWVVDKEGYAD